MSAASLYYRSRLDHTEPGVDPEQAADRYWAEVDRRYEEWRDDQILDNAANPPTKNEHSQQP